MWWFFNSVRELFLEYFLLSEMILQWWYVIIIDFLKTFCVEIYKYTAKLKRRYLRWAIWILFQTLWVLLWQPWIFIAALQKVLTFVFGCMPTAYPMSASSSSLSSMKTSTGFLGIFPEHKLCRNQPQTIAEFLSAEQGQSSPSTTLLALASGSSPQVST